MLIRDLILMDHQAGYLDLILPMCGVHSRISG